MYWRIWKHDSLGLCEKLSALVRINQSMLSFGRIWCVKREGEELVGISR